MSRLPICSRDLHWQWINWALLYDTMEVSMLHLACLTIAQHVFQPALTGRLELISRKIVSCEPGTKAIVVSRFCEKLSPTNWVQGVTAISRKISRSWAPKMKSNMRPRYIQFRDIHDRDTSGVHCTMDSYQIPCHNKTESKLQIPKICKKFKFWNFAITFIRNTPSEVAW